MLHATRRSRNVEGAIDLKRKFSCVILNGEVQELLDFHIIKSLELQVIKLDARGKDSFLNVLNRMRLLENLKFENVTIEDATPDQKAPMHHLKNLTFKSSDVEILGLISTDTLKSFSISDGKKDENVELIIDFLHNQPELESLKFTGHTSMKFFNNSSIQSFPFKLKNLKVKKTDINEATDNFIEFLKCQQDRMDKLSIYSKIDERVLKFILEHLKGVSKLKLDVQNLPIIDKTSFWSNFDVQASVLELKVYNSFVNVETAKKFLWMFPNLKRFNAIKLETLSKNCWFNKLLLALPEMLLRLEHLDVRTLYKERTIRNPRLKFPHLKTLRVYKNCRSTNLFETFVSRHRSTLEKITIKKVFHFDDDNEEIKSEVISAIANCSKLKHFYVGIERGSGTFGIFMNKKSFVLEMRNRSEADIERFIFPDDNAIYNSYTPYEYHDSSDDHYYDSDF